MRWGKHVDVRLSSIVAPGDVKKRQKQPHVLALAQTFREHGGRPGNVMWVRRVAGKGYEIVAGRDRFAALLLVGVKRDTVRPIEDATPEELRDLEEIENLYRRPVENRDELIARRVARVAEQVKAERKEEANTGHVSGDRLARPGPKKTVKGEARERVAAQTGRTPEAVRKADERAAKTRSEEAAGSGSQLGAGSSPVAPPVETFGEQITESERSFVLAQHEMTKAVDNAARAAQAAITKFAQSGWAFQVRAQLEKLNDAAHALGVLARAQKLVAVCPYCKGKGGTACEACGGVGFARAEQMANVPPELLKPGVTFAPKTRLAGLTWPALPRRPAP